MNYLRFNTSRNKYIFDNALGFVIPDNGVLGEVLDWYHEDIEVVKKSLQDNKKAFDVNEVEKAHRFATKCVQNGLFIVDDSKADSISANKLITNAGFSVLILFVTEACNMRCKYCVYSDEYPDEISYSDTNMDSIVMRRAVDTLAALHKKRLAGGYTISPHITFYGGEPLLNFELINEAVEYANSVFSDCGFSITTNGTIMNHEIISLLCNHRFGVTFSLDGTQDNHDRNRVFKNSRPTHSLIMQNVQRLQDYKAKHGLQELITFNCCYDTYTDLLCVNEFFASLPEVFTPFRVMYSPVSPYGTSYYSMLKNGLYDNKELDLQGMYYQLFESFLNGAYGNRTNSLLNMLFSPIYTFATRSQGNIMSMLSSSCVPTAKIAVSPDGTIALCEKMCKKHAIGNVNEGIDMIALERITRNFVDALAKCKECEIRRLCSVCFLQLNAPEDSIREEFCRREIASKKRMLEDVYTTMEGGKSIVDAFNADKMTVHYIRGEDL